MLAPRLSPIRRAVLVLTLANLPGLASAASKTPGFQLQADVLGQTPVGSIGAGDLSDRIGGGAGISVTASTGLTRHLIVGVRATHMRGHKDDTFQFDDNGGLPIPSQPAPSGPYDVRRSLWTTPVHGIAQYRQPIGGVMAFGELGAGVTSFIERDEASTTGGQYMFTIAGYQQNFSMSAGGGVGIPIGLFEVTTGVSFYQAFTTSGDVWANGDDPKFVSFGVGLRYPRF
jgi:hypothetical protein